MEMKIRKVATEIKEVVMENKRDDNEDKESANIESGSGGGGDGAE